MILIIRPGKVSPTAANVVVGQLVVVIRFSIY